MPSHPGVDPDSIRTVNPSTWPQYPYNDFPRTLEQSAVRQLVTPCYDTGGFAGIAE